MNALQDRRSRRRAQHVRLGVLVGVLALSTALGYLHVHHPATWRPAGVDALCPFAGIESLWSLLSSGTFVKKTVASGVALLVATVVVALIMGRSFCGQLCPLGTLQELFGRLGTRLFKRRYAMPAVLDRPARFLKYAVLAIFTLWTWRVGELVMRPYDPWATYHHLTSAELFTEFGVGAAVLGITVIGSLVYDRFFCKYACPMGAFLAVLSRASIFKVRRDVGTCVDCGACTRACPVNIPVEAAITVTSAECISCSECVTACPMPGALTISSPRKSAISPMMLTFVTLAVFLGVIGIASAGGQFSLMQPTLAGEVRRAIDSGEPFDATTIKGSTTMQEIADATGIPSENLQSAFGLSAQEMRYPLKEVKALHGFTMEDVRGYVAYRLTGATP